MMALIALVAMSLAAMAMIRSVDTGNVIAGNAAFRQASSQAVDIAMESAFTYMTNTLTDANISTDQPGGCAGNCVYYATKQAENAYDIPNVINWTNVPAVSLAGLGIDGAYQVRYVLERLCSVANVTDPADQCYLTKQDPKCQQNNPGNPSVCADTQGTYFRTTVYVTGPRNTKTYSQSTFVRY